MLIPNLLMWTAAAIGAAWKVSQLWRVPDDRGLRVVTTCTVLVFAALTAQLAANIPALGPQSPKLIQNVFLTVFFALLLVLLQSAGQPATRSAVGYREIALALLASAGLIAAFALTAPADRGASYEEANGEAGVLAFYFIGNLYMAYATARGARLAWRVADHTVSRARLSLRIAAGGLVVCCGGTHLPRVIATAGLFTTGHPVLPRTEVWTTPLLAAGITVFFAGLAYPGIRTGWAKTRLWFEQRRHHRQLRPLWSTLAAQFPHIVLFPPRSPLHDAWNPRQMRLRYYRRIVECRDGLVLLSPYMESLDDPASPAHQATQIWEAIKRRESNAAQVSAASVIAPPTESGMDADVNVLLALARELAVR
ncbi:MAB_1171c family putative transporter [Saccharopolyspora pogona]|uniref:MAB_1171c family putative transporter n=1 Tax=Saccharopolyspora pogona TaxID=333966 RepID=UPI001CC22B93|nr:MAB_1171c family putative transporter [Saccharopolyspora pogona]